MSSEFNARVRNLRTSLGLSQEYMADQLKISRPTYSRYESGTREPNMANIAEIAIILSCSTDFLLGLTDDPTPPHKKEPPQEGRRIKASVIDEEGNIVEGDFYPEEERELEEMMLDARVRQIAWEVAQEVIQAELKKHNAS